MLNKNQENDDILQIQGITKRFDGVTALNEVSSNFKRGQLKAIIGPNGAGKTTLLNVISGLLSPNSGTIYFKKHKITGLMPNSINFLGVSRTFQIVRLITNNNATVLDNILLGAHRDIDPKIYKSIFCRSKMIAQEKIIKEKALKTLDFVGLNNVENLSPSSLSFGNQRLVELARALISEPELLLLDEPASGLNSAEVDNLIKLLLNLRSQGISIILVEHNMRMVMDIAEDILVLNYGKKLAEGPPDEIASNPEVVEAYLGKDYSKYGLVNNNA